MMTRASASCMYGALGVESVNPLRDHLLDLGHEQLAQGCERHSITSLGLVHELIDNAYGWEAADTSSELETIRSLVRILDRYAPGPSDSELLHWL